MRACVAMRVCTCGNVLSVLVAYGCTELCAVQSPHTGRNGGCKATTIVCAAVCVEWQCRLPACTELWRHRPPPPLPPHPHALQVTRAKKVVEGMRNDDWGNEALGDDLLPM